MKQRFITSGMVFACALFLWPSHLASLLFLNGWKSLFLVVLQYPVVFGLIPGFVVGAVRIHTAPWDRKRNDLFIAVLALTLPVNLACDWITRCISPLRPLKYDLYLYQIDGLLGFQPSFALARIVERNASLLVLLSVIYSLLPLVMVVVFCAQLWGRSEREALLVVKAFVLNLVAAVPIYMLIPVCGPQYAFPQFPQAVADVAAHPILLSAPPNGIPSVHTSSALLIAWYLRPWALGRVCGGAFLALMVAATLALGEHYLFDLIVALPYAVGVHWLAQSRWTRAAGSTQLSNAGLTTRRAAGS